MWTCYPRVLIITSQQNSSACSIEDPVSCWRRWIPSSDQEHFQTDAVLPPVQLFVFRCRRHSIHASCPEHEGKGQKSLDSRICNDQFLYEQLQNTVSFIKHESYVMERVRSTGICNSSFLDLYKLSTSLPEESPLKSRVGKISPHFHPACKSLLKTQQLPCMGMFSM